MSKLTPDGIQARLPAGIRLVALDEVDSTNSEAARRAEAGAEEGLLIWAGAQSAGRGRRGRGFVSPPGNVFSSLLLRPDCPAGVAAQVSFLAALAVAETAEAVLPAGVELACKWPNDVLVGRRKVSGILVESRARQGGGVEWLIIGTGINVAHYPEGTETPATALNREGAAAGREDVLVRYVTALVDWLAIWRAEGFAPVRAAWLKRADGLGQTIRVRLSDRTDEGVFEGLDEDGALVLAEAGGNRRRVTAGEIFRAEE